MKALEILNKYKSEQKFLLNRMKQSLPHRDIRIINDDIESCEIAIEELEALENRSCDNCKYKSSNYDKSITWCINEKVNKSNLHDLIIEDDFYCNKWESK